MRNPSIRISPKYGVNPTIPICLYCGKERNELALMGHIKEKDAVKESQETQKSQQ